jgi:predicted SAM-dependent methyltransferase
MKQILRMIPGLVKLKRKVHYLFRVFRNHLRLKISARRKPLKIVVGASGVFNEGWVFTDMENLNLLEPSDWHRYFQVDSIDAILAEHVWEHLSYEEGAIAAYQCFEYLKPGGYLRIAVPDGNFPDSSYIQGVDIGVDGHKELYNNETLSGLFEGAGFVVQLLEYFDKNHQFHYNEWDPDEGMIHRSKRFDKRNADDKLKYTSIILDAVKPDNC